MSSVVIETQNLTKKYGSFTAVSDLNLTVRQGEVFGLLGPNGAGKTTTILMLLGLTEPTSGSVRVLGLDPSRQPLKVKARVGYLPDSVGFYNELSAWDNLHYIARLNGLPGKKTDQAIESVLNRVGLNNVAGKPVGAFSHGMRQRLGVADVLIKQPDVIIMDEPTQGLDPEGAREFLDLIRDLKNEGITVLLSSHLLHQVQAICDRVGLFSRGEMVLVGSVPELARKVLGRAYRVSLEVDGENQAVLQALNQVAGAKAVSQIAPRLFEVESEEDLRAQTARAVVQTGANLLKLDVETQSLDEIYTHYFKEVNHAQSR